MSGCQRFLLENELWVVTRPLHVPAYDFDFRQFFQCHTPWEPGGKKPAVARVGAFPDYQRFYDELAGEGIYLVNSPEEHDRASFLPLWYPRISGLTPRSRWFEGFPPFEELEQEFGLPFFLKGARQTSRHQAALSVVRSREQYEDVIHRYAEDPILRWQQLVCREFVLLRPAGVAGPGELRVSYEFRTFWWKGRYVGGGRYWHEAGRYHWTDQDREDALALGAQAAKAVDCAFLVVDLAMTLAGEWIVIECNDAMESGYAGVPRELLWRNIVETLRAGDGLV